MDRLDALLGLEATNGSVGTTSKKHPDALMQGFLFNIRFILTYQLCLLGLTACLTLAHCVSIWHRQRRRKSLPVRDAPRSSRSSTSSASDRFLKHGSDEAVPLLSGVKKESEVSTINRARRWTRSLFMMHPTWRKDLQGNDITAFLLLMFGLNVFYALYNAPLARPLIYIFADRTGLVFVANLPWLYLLSAKNQPFRLLTGASYEGLNVLHRELGKWLAILAVLHTTGMVIVWYDFLMPRGYDLWWYLTRDIIWLGILAIICYEVLCMTSLQWFRNWWYEMFLGCHIILQTGGLVFLFFHHPRIRLYVGAALVIFLVDRLVYRLTLKTRTFEADLSVFEDGQTVLLRARWPLKRRPRWQSWFKPGDLSYGWDPADHLFLTVPALARKHKMQAHPFTIAAPAPAAKDAAAHLILVIRVRDGFTKDLLHYAEHNPTTMVRLDGPYGSNHALEMMQDSSIAIVLAGGSGIAVALPLVASLLEQVTDVTPQICLIWVVNDSRHTDWVETDMLDDLKARGMKLIIPPPTSKAGRPDIPELLHDTARELSGGDRNAKTALIISGPDAMNRAARNAAARMARHGIDISVAVEVFDW